MLGCGEGADAATLVAHRSREGRAYFQMRAEEGSVKDPLHMGAEEGSVQDPLHMGADNGSVQDPHPAPPHPRPLPSHFREPRLVQF